MNWCFAIALILHSSVALSDDLRADWDPEVREGWKKTLVSSVPRLFERIGVGLFHSSIVKRTTNTVKIPVDLVTVPGKALRDTANGLANPGADLNAVITDVGGLVKTTLAVRAKVFHRVRVCSMNLAQTSDNVKKNGTPNIFSFINPTMHVGIVVDGIEEYGEISESQNLVGWMELGHEAFCQPVAIKSGRSPLITLEKLKCVSSKYSRSSDYSFFGYNCGGIAKALLRHSGMTEPTLNNLGIGEDIPTPSRARRNDERELDQYEAECESELGYLWEVIQTLEKGNLPSNADLDILNEAMKKKSLGWDATLQLYLLTQKIPESQTKDSWRFQDLMKYIRESLKPKLKKVVESNIKETKAARRFWSKRADLDQVFKSLNDQ